MNGWSKARLYIGTLAMGLAITAFVAGCGASSTGTNNAGTQNAGSTSNTSAGSTSTATAAGDSQQGMKLFQQNCSMCHSTGSNRVVGPGLKGIMTKSKLPNGHPINDANVMDWIRTGGGGMPGFPQLTDQQRADIVAYLNTLS